jgi:hypothetical protein
VVWIEPNYSVLYEGENAEFTCFTNATVPISYNWSVNGNTEGFGEWHVDSPILKYENLKPVDNYTLIHCEVLAESNGSIIALTGESVVVFKSAPYIVPVEQNFSVHERSNFTLPCLVEGDYLLKYWTRNGVVVSDDSGTVVNTELGLVLTNVSRIDAGVYTCTVAWIGGFVSSPPMKLIVYYLPSFLVQPHPTTVVLFISVSFSLHCVAEGLPSPTVAWFRDGVAVQDNIVFANGSLHVESASLQDRGFYHCTASNEVGTSRSRKAFVSVRYPILNPPVLSLFNLTRDHMTVTWSIDGDLEAIECLHISMWNATSDTPVVEVQLPKDQRMYSLSQLVPHTVYEVVVSVVTQFTTVKSLPASFKTLESVPEDSPQNIVAVNITNVSAILKWEEPTIPNGRIRGYRVRLKPGDIDLTVGREQHSTLLVDLIPYTKYVVLIRAFTGAGNGPNGLVNFKTLQGTFPPCVPVRIQPPTFYYGLNGAPYSCEPRSTVSRCMFVGGKIAKYPLSRPFCAPRTSQPQYVNHRCTSLTKGTSKIVTFLLHFDYKCVIIR